MFHIRTQGTFENNEVFNQDIADWDVSRVENFQVGAIILQRMSTVGAMGGCFFLTKSTLCGVCRRLANVSQIPSVYFNAEHFQGCHGIPPGIYGKLEH